MLQQQQVDDVRCIMMVQTAGGMPPLEVDALYQTRADGTIGVHHERSLKPL